MESLEPFPNLVYCGLNGWIGLRYSVMVNARLTPMTHKHNVTYKFMSTLHE